MRYRALWAVPLVFVVATSACTSSKSSGGPSSTSTGTAGSVKPPIKIMVLAPWDNAVADLGDAPIQVQIFADDVNKHGGINGQQLIVEPCNDRWDGNAAEQCARKAVSDHVTMMLGGYTFFGSRVFPILEAAKIPWLGAAVTDSFGFSSPMVFATSTAPMVAIASTVLLSREPACKRIGLIVGASVYTGQIKQSTDAGIKGVGKAWSTVVSVPSTATDMSAFAAQITQKSDCIDLDLTNAQTAQFIPSLIATGWHGQVATIFGDQITQATIDQYRKDVQGWIIAGGYPPLTDPAWRPYVTLMTANQSKLGKYFGSIAGATETRGWVGWQLLLKVASNINGDMTSASLISAMSTEPSCEFKLEPLAPNMNFCKENPAKAIKRVINTSVYEMKIDNGKLVAAGGYVDLEPYYLKGIGQ